MALTVDLILLLIALGFFGVLVIAGIAPGFPVLRVITAALAFGAVVSAIVLGVFAYYAVAAARAHDVPTSAAVNAAFAEAGRGWVRHTDIPVHRLALSSAEEFGSGSYLFVFDVYTWLGIGSGYVAQGCGGGGIVRYGGFAGIGDIASETALEDARAQCIRAYGPGRPVAPAP